MKKAMSLLVLVVAGGLVGCVHTVTENQPGRGPGYRDYVEARHAKPVDVVFEASKRALLSFGNITTDGKVFATTNQVRIVEGAVNGKRVYIRVEAVDPLATSVRVQVRTKAGMTDLRMANDLVQQIDMELR